MPPRPAYDPNGRHRRILAVRWVVPALPEVVRLYLQLRVDR